MLYIYISHCLALCRHIQLRLVSFSLGNFFYFFFYNFYFQFFLWKFLLWYYTSWFPPKVFYLLYFTSFCCCFPKTFYLLWLYIFTFSGFFIELFFLLSCSCFINYSTLISLSILIIIYFSLYFSLLLLVLLFHCWWSLDLFILIDTVWKLCADWAYGCICQVAGFTGVVAIQLQNPRITVCEGFFLQIIHFSLKMKFLNFYLTFIYVEATVLGTGTKRGMEVCCSYFHFFFSAFYLQE